MSEITDTMVDGLIEREADQQAVLIWPSGSADPGDRYPCSGSPRRAVQNLDLGGFKPWAEVTITVRTALFPDQATRPKTKHSVGYIMAPDAVPELLRIDEITLVNDAVMVFSCNTMGSAA